MVWYKDIVFKVLLFYVYDVKVISIEKKKYNSRFSYFKKIVLNCLFLIIWWNIYF